MGKLEWEVEGDGRERGEVIGSGGDGGSGGFLWRCWLDKLSKTSRRHSVEGRMVEMIRGVSDERKKSGDAFCCCIVPSFIAFFLTLSSAFGTPLSVLPRVCSPVVPRSCHLWDILST